MNLELLEELCSASGPFGPAAFAIKPDLAIDLDVTIASGTRGCKKMTAVKWGKGPAIKVMDGSVSIDPRIRDFIMNCAKKNGITYRFEIFNGGGNRRK